MTTPVTAPIAHQMTLEHTFPTGAQQWLCPTCQRRTVMHYLPQQARLKTITLQAGDDEATHCTGSGGLHMVTVSAGEAHGSLAPTDSGLLH